MPVPLSPCSAAHRMRIASAISPLKRVRPKTPFYKLAAHRIPTLWSLYRGLLRHAPGENIRFRVRALFRRNHHVVKAQVAKEKLLMGYKWLEFFKRAEQGDEKLERILSRYESMIAAKREKEAWKRRIRDAFDWEAKLRRRPIFKGSFIRPSLDNKLLPHLIPQPPHISGMIVRRRIARERRWEQRETLKNWAQDLRHESIFEYTLLKQSLESYAHQRASELVQMVSEGTELPWDPVYTGDSRIDWEEPIKQLQVQLGECMARDVARYQSAFPPELVLQGKQARRTKVANQSAQRQRERSGEVTTATIKRRRSAPPAHIRELMNQKQLLVDRAIREVSEGGWSGAVKARMGVHMHTPDKWKAEGGWEDQEKKKRLDDMEHAIRAENERRRKHSQLEVPPLST